MFTRLQTLPLRRDESCFFWGARQTGKSTLLDRLFPGARRYDLLLSDQFERLNRRPAFLREELLAEPPGSDPVIIDEVQKVPLLLDEVHWLMERRRIRFILCGSSARKLKRSGGNLLGGRAIRHELFPLVYPEIDTFNLLRALNHGLLPRHYLADDPRRLLRAYIGDYLKEEIAAEALSRNIPAFGRFLESAAFSNAEIVNYQNIARECGVSPPTVKEYFQILSDTLIGKMIPSFRRRPKRRVILAPKFYFFDVGIANGLLKRGVVELRGESFGKALEHFIMQELTAHSHYSGLDYDVNYWRTASGLEVDFILGGGAAAVEVKGTEAHRHHFSGMNAFCEEHKVKHAIIVSTDARPRRDGRILIYPWEIFLKKLWAGELIR